MNQRDAFVEKINKAKEEIKTAGVIHKRDLQKYIRRLERELREYENYHKLAQTG